MARAVLLDRNTGRPVVDPELRQALEERQLHHVAEQLELGRLRPDLVATEQNPPLYMDVSSAYSGDELGLPHRDILSEGIVGPVGAGSGGLNVTGQGGANSINIAKGACWVLGDTNADLQPNYRCYNDAIVNIGINPDASNPRRVLVVAQVTDQSFAGTGRLWALQAIHGTPAGSPTLPATPASALPLSNILVPAAAANSGAYTFTDLRVAASVAGGKAGGKTVQILVSDPNGAAITVGDGKAYFTISRDLAGLSLVDVAIAVTTVSSAGLPTVQLANMSGAIDMLSTKVTIDATEFTSYTAATPPVINAANARVAAGDFIRVDVDVAGTGAKGLMAMLTFGTP